MFCRPWRVGMWLAGGCCLAAAVQAQAVDAPVAGLQPDRRPVAAPRLLEAPVDADLRQRRLAGISQPWPGNVERIAEQGGWYSPMFLPGMSGPYDLRGWHRDRPR